MKTYTRKQIFDFCDAYKLAKDNGLVKELDHRSKFMDKFLVSLYTLGTLVRENRTSEWVRGRTDSHHSWLDYIDGKFALNTRNRTDDWSTGIVDTCLTYFQKDAVQRWTEFIKTDEYKENVKIVADYYTTTGGYFRNYIELVRNDEVLDEHSYERFVKNKYASKVIEAYRSEPLFAVGSLADFRTNAQCTGDRDGVAVAYKRSPNGIMILSNTEPIINACKGAKRYKAVCIGDTVPFYIEERYLKNRKKRK